MAVVRVESVGSSPDDVNNVQAVIDAASEVEKTYIELIQKDPETEFELGSSRFALGSTGNVINKEIELVGVPLEGELPTLHQGNASIITNSTKPLTLRDFKLRDYLGVMGLFPKFVPQGGSVLIDNVSVSLATGAPFAGASTWGILIGASSAPDEIKGPVEVKNCNIDLETETGVDRSDIDPDSWTAPTYDAAGDIVTAGVANPDAWLSYGIVAQYSTPTAGINIHDCTVKNCSTRGIEVLRNRAEVVIEDNLIEMGPYGAHEDNESVSSYGVVATVKGDYEGFPVAIRKNEIVLSGVDQGGIFIGSNPESGGLQMSRAVVSQNRINGTAGLLGILASEINGALIGNNRIAGAFRVGLLSGFVAQDEYRPIAERIFGCDHNVWFDNDLDDFTLLASHAQDWPVTAHVHVTGNAFANIFTGRGIHKKVIDDRGVATQIS